jgi:hypothetical protein
VAGITNFLDTTPDIAQQQAQLLNTLQGAWGQWLTDLNTMISLAGKPGVAPLTRFIQQLDKLTESFITLEEKAPGLVTLMFDATAAFGALAVIGGAITAASATFPAFAAAFSVFGLLFTPGGAIALAVLGLGAAAVFIVQHFNVITSATNRLAEQVRIAFNQAFKHIQQFLHDITFGLIPGPTWTPGLPGSVAAMPGFAPIFGIGGAIAGYRRVGPGGVPTGPMMTLDQMQQWAAQHPSVGAPPGGGGQRIIPGKQGLIINGGIHVTVQGHPDDPHTTDRMVKAVVGAIHRAGLGISAVGGTFESPYILGGSPA